MALIDELINDVSLVLSNNWNIRDGQVVPFSDQVRLAGGAVRLEATMLYADLADSTELAMRFDRRVAAKAFKSFLTCSSRIIRARGGEIRSFDGDRVMGIFLGPLKNTSAAKCALNINYAFTEIIKPRLEAKYSQLQTDYKLAHCVGIDTSEVLAVRGGVVNNNDLVWVGRAPNVAAKLSGLREPPYHSFITAAVYNKVQENVKFSPDGSYMWEQRTWGAVDGVSKIYRSSWWWKP
jgi:class 3 adenylate cyclase